MQEIKKRKALQRGQKVLDVSGKQHKFWSTKKPPKEELWEVRPEEHRRAPAEGTGSGEPWRVLSREGHLGAHD